MWQDNNNNNCTTTLLYIKTQSPLSQYSETTELNRVKAKTFQ